MDREQNPEPRGWNVKVFRLPSRNFFTPEVLIFIGCFACLFAARAFWTKRDAYVDARQFAHFESQILMVDLNHCDATELTLLPGVGGSLSSRILIYRETHGRFQRMEELLLVDGIGPTTLKRIEPFITIR